MPYSPQTWIDNNASYPLSAARMTNIETGVQSAASVADQGHRILTTVQKTALGTVTTGTQVYDSTLGQQQVYNGTTWVPVGGWVLLDTTSFTSATSIVPGGAVFSSLYENYVIQITGFSTTASSVNIFMKMRNGASSDGTAAYTYALTGLDSGNVTQSTVGINGTAGFIFATFSNTGSIVSTGTAFLFSPFSSVRYTTGWQTSTYLESSVSRWSGRSGALVHGVAASYDRFELIPNGATAVTGTVRTYGVIS